MEDVSLNMFNLVADKDYEKGDVIIFFQDEGKFYNLEQIKDKYRTE